MVVPSIIVSIIDTSLTEESIPQSSKSSKYETISNIISSKELISCVVPLPSVDNDVAFEKSEQGRKDKNIQENVKKMP